MAPPKNRVWKYFTKKTHNCAQCNSCSKILKSSGNTTNLVAHLRLKHAAVFKTAFDLKESEMENAENNELGGHYDPQPNIPRPSTSKIRTSVTEASAGPSHADESPPKQPQTSPENAEKSLSQSLQPVQQTITRTMKNIASFSANGSNATRITNAITYFICKDNMPFSTVEGEGFLKLLNKVSPLYKVPTRNTFKNLIDKKYETAALLFKEKLKFVEHVTLTTDIWTDTQTKSFLGVTIHYIVEAKLVSATLGVIELQESHTAQYISLEFINLLNYWGITIDNVVAVVTDNGANIVKAVCDTFGRNKHVPCLAHTLNLICENSVRNIEGLNEPLQKVRTIVTWMKRSVHASDQLRKQQKDRGIPEGMVKKLILDVKTRWNSTFYMADRFIELAPLVANITFENVNAPEMLSAIEIANLKEIIQLLKPLEKMTTEICGEKFVTLSKVIPMVRCVLEQYSSQLNPSSNLGQKLKTAILMEFTKRFGQIEKSHLLATATMLDPRFKQLHFKDALACSTTINLLRRQVTSTAEEILDNSDDDRDDVFDLWKYHKKLTHSKRRKLECTTDSYLHDEIAQYLQTPVIDLNQDPLPFWEGTKTVFPNLYKEAQKYLGIVATSVPSERLFSKAGVTASATRNRLTGKRLSRLLFLQSIPAEYWK